MKTAIASVFAVLIAFAAVLASHEARAGSSVHFGLGYYSWGGHHHGHWRHHRHHHRYGYHRYHRHRHYHDDHEYEEPEPAAAKPAGAATVDPSAPAPYCREYTTSVVIDGVPQEAYGTACQQEDGSWKIIDSSVPLQF